MKSFINGNNDWDERTISIKMDKDTIYFYFDNAVKQFYERQQFIIENNIDDDNEQKEPTYFYWIDKAQFKNPLHNWEEHMANKSWFTQEMLDYINQNL